MAAAKTRKLPAVRTRDPSKAGYARVSPQVRDTIPPASRAPQPRTYQPASSGDGFQLNTSGVSTATTIILVAGGITFVNEWYQTRQVNWRVPLATLLLAAGFEGLSKLDPTVATGLAIMALIGAVTAEFNGKSAAATIADLFPSSGTVSKTAPKAKAKTS